MKNLPLRNKCIFPRSARQLQLSVNALLLFGVVFIKWAMAAQPYTAQALNKIRSDGRQILC
jgi:hypothetical protein